MSITIGGDEVQSVTIDGDEVQGITVDGEVVFSGGLIIYDKGYEHPDFTIDSEEGCIERKSDHIYCEDYRGVAYISSYDVDFNQFEGDTFFVEWDIGNIDGFGQEARAGMYRYLWDTDDDDIVIGRVSSTTGTVIDGVNLDGIHDDLSRLGFQSYGVNANCNQEIYIYKMWID